MMHSDPVHDAAHQLAAAALPTVHVSEDFHQHLDLLPQQIEQTHHS
jgi:hypothetical protein